MSQPGPLERACALVGRFIHHHGRIEQKINHAVIKLLDLDERNASVVVSLVTFANKVTLLEAAASDQAQKEEDKKFARSTRGKIFAINDDRNVVAHSSFEPAPDGDGVQFKRTKTKDGRIPDVALWKEEDFTKKYRAMKELEGELDRLIEIIKPVPWGWQPNFDWVPSWQETYQPRRSAATMGGSTNVPPPLPTEDGT
jgi:hypothetical protein